MGSSQSHSEAHRVTIERSELEREAFNVVHISEDALNRLTGATGRTTGDSGTSGNTAELEVICLS